MSDMRPYTYVWEAGLNDPVLKITKSSLGTFVWCPKQYEFSRIDGLPTDQTEAMMKGSIIHNSHEDFFKQFDIAKAENMTHSELADYCLSLYPIDDYIDQYETLAVFNANRFMETSEEDKPYFLPVCNEVLLDAEVTIDRADFPHVHLHEDYTIHLQGIIDRIYYDREVNGYVLMELKTGMWKDGNKSKMRKEMAFYKYVIDSCSDEMLTENGLDPDIPVTHWGWIFPASNHFYTEPVLKASATAMLKSISELLVAYQDGLFPTKFSSYTCPQYCSFYGICDSAQMDGWL
tara:strand:- start:5540 stop:6409 length:870 start_codon:yes stop_codon:yes gene_type:complete